MLNAKSPEVVTFLADCQKLVDKSYGNTTYSKPPTLTAEDGGKVIKIVSNGSQRMVYCFIAKVDNNTKALGEVKCGDVLKSASWKAPAKHARGNLFDSAKGMSQMGPYGAAYLR